jgi:hypothetical protein
MDERVFFDWQFSLSTRLCQIMEERKISKQEFAQLVNISEAELDGPNRCFLECRDPEVG